MDQVFGVSLHRSKKSIASISQPGHDIGVIIKMVVQAGRVEGNIRMRIVKHADAFGR